MGLLYGLDALGRVWMRLGDDWTPLDMKVPEMHDTAAEEATIQPAGSNPAIPRKGSKKPEMAQDKPVIRGTPVQ